MNRRIVCEPCKLRRGPQHPEDVACGWKRRIVEITAKKPSDHKIEILGDNPEVINLRSLFCDDCGVPISDGGKAFAITMWRDMEGEPDDWEKEYQL